MAIELEKIWIEKAPNAQGVTHFGLVGGTVHSQKNGESPQKIDGTSWTMSSQGITVRGDVSIGNIRPAETESFSAMWMRHMRHGGTPENEVDLNVRELPLIRANDRRFQ